jgi:hypothetical protein
MAKVGIPKYRQQSHYEAARLHDTNNCDALYSSQSGIPSIHVSEPETRLEDQPSESLYEELKQKQDDQMIGIPCTLDK